MCVKQLFQGLCKKIGFIVGPSMNGKKGSSSLDTNEGSNQHGHTWNFVIWVIETRDLLGNL